MAIDKVRISAEVEWPNRNHIEELSIYAIGCVVFGSETGLSDLWIDQCFGDLAWAVMQMLS
jgi:hypothetical protein